MEKPKLAVYVDEPETGVFTWVLLECGPDGMTWASIEAGTKMFGNWTAALEAGNSRLFQVAHDRDAAVH